MEGSIFYNAGKTEAAHYAAEALKRQGCTFTNDFLKCTHLLTDVPYRDGTLPDLLPEGITIIGGNLPKGNSPVIDLLQDPEYLAENASITAHCAVKLALGMLPVILDNCPVLVIGWGRIGKCLAALLRQMGAAVCVAARKEADRAMLKALGYQAIDIKQCARQTPRIIFNTVPVLVADSIAFPPKTLKIELASLPGIQGVDVVDGRRLPGRFAPESSGELIARSILRLLPGGD